MLTIVIPAVEYFDEETSEFVSFEEVVVELEHSLASLSKWEEIHEKPFLSKEQKTSEEILSYIKCMVLTPGVPDDVFNRLSKQNVDAIEAYFESKRSATWFNDFTETSTSRETITSELIYYWMNSFQIHPDMKDWNLNRLFNLIKIHGMKNAKPKKMSQADLAARNRALNAKRRQEMGTSG